VEHAINVINNGSNKLKNINGLVNTDFLWFRVVVIIINVQNIVGVTTDAHIIAARLALFVLNVIWNIDLIEDGF
jgi:hypothetical protein